MDKKEALKDFIGHLATSLSLVRKCQFPFGHPGDSDFHFCGEKVELGTSYCKKHRELCYRPAKN
tara:strand:+ start:1612 stop:1803 length:192 start_codon:yes stop_codon:yes gene_type:complete